LESYKFKKPLNLGYYNNHFVALLAKEKNFLQISIENEMSLIQYKNKIKLKKYD
jgi:hypothetical protein